MHISLNHRAVFVGAVVVGGDAACAVVHALAHGGVTQIGQVVGLGALGQRGVFHFHKVADVHLGPELGPRPQTGKRANEGASAHGHAELLSVDMGERMDDRTRLNHRIGNDTVRADGHPLAQAHLALEDAVDINAHVMCTQQVATHVDTCRVRQAHALFHQAVGLPQLVSTLQLGQLHRAVDASHLHRVVYLVRHHLHPIGHRELHDVGQIELLLRILVVQPRQPALELGGGHGHDAAVNLGNLLLCGRCILVLHDGLHGIPRAHDAAITRGVTLFQRQQRQLVARAGRDQVEQGVGLG